ncbi:MAG: heme exporter protein CcmB, partial [bacterium]|nr:heme exporter protein CcmB [bacterium]
MASLSSPPTTRESWATESRSSSWAGEALAVFAKDWLLELRTRVALGAVVLFAVTSVVAAGIALAPPSGVATEVKAALLWVVLFFAAVAGLSRTFVVEEETRTADALRLAVSPAGVFVGKLLFNVALMWALCLVVVPLYLLLLEAPVRYLSLLTTVVLLGSGALACATTAVGAIVARSTMRGALFGVLAFPVALPPMLVSIHG